VGSKEKATDTETHQSSLHNGRSGVIKGGRKLRKYGVTYYPRII
jgi:hypothetical protein